MSTLGWHIAQWIIKQQKEIIRLMLYAIKISGAIADGKHAFTKDATIDSLDERCGNCLPSKTRR